MTCFVTILILTGYVHFIMKRNGTLFRGNYQDRLWRHSSDHAADDGAG